MPQQSGRHYTPEQREQYKQDIREARKQGIKPTTWARHNNIRPCTAQLLWREIAALWRKLKNR